jgi:hypothetical protein
VHNDTQASLFHLICGPTMGHPLTDGASLIAMGIDNAGVGLYVNNKKTGIGIKITQRETITSATAYGMLVSGGPGAAPAVFMQQNNVDGSGNAQPLLVLHAYQSFSSAQKMMEWRKPNGTSTGALVGYVLAETGAIVQQADLTVSGGNLVVIAAGGVGGNATVGSLLAQGDGAYLGFYDTTGTVDSRRFRLSQTAGILVLSARNDDGTSKASLFSITQAGTLTTTGGVVGTFVSGAGTGAYLDFQDDAHTTNVRRWRLSQSSGSLLISLRTDAGATVRNPIVITGSNGNVTLLDGAAIVAGTSTGLKIGSATNQKLGFYNATPIVQPAAVPVDAAGIHAALVSLGLIAA